MPLTPAERQKRYYTKKKASQQFKDKKSKTAKDYRTKLSGEKLKRAKRLAAIRVRNFRERAKEVAQIVTTEGEQPSTSGSGPFASRQSAGKAVKCAASGLPKSPRKLKFVASKVAEIPGLALTSPTRSTLSFRGIDAETKKLVVDFYKNYDISRQLPGRKDVRRVKDASTGEKTSVPKWLLMLNLREVFTIFKEQHPDRKIGISKFCTLRPKEVCLVSSKSQEVCCCPYCENMTFLFNAATWKPHKQISNLSHLVASMVCDTNRPECMKQQCNSCPCAIDTSNTLQELMVTDEADEILVKQWNGSLLEIKKVNITELCEEIHSQMYKYLKHIFNMKTQANAFRKKKEELTNGELIIQTDFAENYTIRHQNEVMAAHWMPSTGESVTIYTSVVHYIINEEQHMKAFAVISDTMVHSSVETHVFNSRIIDHLKSENIPINSIHIWTDGAAAHFKNRYSLATLTFYDTIYNLSTKPVWNFFESYHGKSPHDGIGALLKWNVYRRVLQGRAVVRNAKDLYNVANDISIKTTLIYVSKEDIEADKPYYMKLWTNCKATYSIQQARCIKSLGKYRLALYHNTNDDNSFKQCNLEPEPDIGGEDVSSLSSFDNHAQLSDDSLDDIDQSQESSQLETSIDFETESDSLVPVSIKEELLGYDEDDTEMKTWNFNLMNSHTIFSPQRYRDDPLIQGDPVERDPVEKVSIKEEAPDSDQIEAQYFKEIEQMEVFPDVEFNIKTEDDL